MKLRFEVDQAACLRAGIDCEKSIVTVDIKPADLPQEERSLLADRLEGIDVCMLEVNKNGQIQKLYPWEAPGRMNADAKPKPMRIIADAPTYDGLIAAVRENERIVREVQPKVLEAARAKEKEKAEEQTVRDRFLAPPQAASAPGQA